MSNSTHVVECVPISLEKHDNAENLSLVKVFDSYTVIVNTEMWKDVKLGAFIPPENLVDTRLPAFSFLLPKARADGWCLIKGMKLRGILSYGLLVPAPEGAKEGDDLTAHFGVVHYERPEPGSSGSAKDKFAFAGENEASPPNIIKFKYDLESGEKYGKRMFENEEIVVHEKMEGENFAAVFSSQTNKLYCSSRQHWKREYPSYKEWTREKILEKGIPEDKVDDLLKKFEREGARRSRFWYPVVNVPQIEVFCRKYPDFVLYGELVGTVGGFPYTFNNQISFLAFDVTDKDGKFLDYDVARSMADSVGVPWSPELFRGKFDADHVKSLASGMTTLGGKHCREGCVCKTVIEKNHERYGRRCLKWKGSEYTLLKN